VIPNLFNDGVSVKHLYSVEGGMGIGKDAEGRDRGLLNVLFRR
jgi:hypothetical protein